MRPLPRLTRRLDHYRDQAGLNDTRVRQLLADKGFDLGSGIYSMYRSADRLMPTAVLVALCDILDVPRDERLQLFELQAEQDRRRRLERSARDAAGGELITA